jgi:hypothetical protein
MDSEQWWSESKNVAGLIAAALVWQWKVPTVRAATMVGVGRAGGAESHVGTSLENAAMQGPVRGRVV